MVFAFLAMLFGSWQRWTSMIVDFGRETDLPLRIMNGEMLYRDIHYIYPPLAPYLNALIFWIFGPHLNTLVGIGIFFSAILTFLCYRIAIRIMPPLGASIATSFIVVLCFFKPAGNLMLSYSFAGVQAAVFSLSAVVFVLRYAERKNKKDVVFAGVFVGLAAIAKQEFAFAAAVTMAAYLIYLHRRDFRAFAAELALAVVPALIIAVPVFALLFANIDAKTLIVDCHLFYTHIPDSLIFYNRFRSGTDYPLASFIQMIGSAALNVASVALLVLVSDRNGKLRTRTLLIFGFSAAVTAVVLYFFFYDWDGSPLRALPFLLFGTIFIEWRRRSKQLTGTYVAAESNDETSHHLIFIVAVYSIAILIRVVLRVPSGGFSGSFYLPTSLILITYWLIYLLPQYIGKWTADGLSLRRATRITAAICILAVTATGISLIVKFRNKYGYRINARRGSLYGENYSAPVIDQALKFIEANTQVGDFISVLPEGNDFAFMTGRRINFRHQVLIPDFLSQQDELDAIEALKRGDVRYIFVPNRAMREFGAYEFGKDFYQTLGNWIEENYSVEKILGIEDGREPVVGQPPFFIKIYKRKDQ